MAAAGSHNLLMLLSPATSGIPAGRSAHLKENDLILAGVSNLTNTFIPFIH
jgi:hypothetical protein